MAGKLLSGARLSFRRKAEECRIESDGNVSIKINYRRFRFIPENRIRLIIRRLVSSATLIQKLMIRVKKKRKIAADFFDRPTLAIARDLLGKVLIRKIDGKKIAVKITETEAYVGPRDRASHASRGRTKRTEPMFGSPGTVYVYLVYGMYHCLNIVTENEGFPAAVLIRSAVPLDGRTGEKETDGPGKLCRFLKIDKKFNGTSVFKNKNLWLEDWDFKIPPSEIGKGRRIGVEYAGSWAKKLWRFYVIE